MAFEFDTDFLQAFKPVRAAFPARFSFPNYVIRTFRPPPPGTRSLQKYIICCNFAHRVAAKRRPTTNHQPVTNVRISGHTPALCTAVQKISGSEHILQYPHGLPHTFLLRPGNSHPADAVPCQHRALQLHAHGELWRPQGRGSQQLLLVHPAAHRRQRRHLHPGRPRRRPGDNDGTEDRRGIPGHVLPHPPARRRGARHPQLCLRQNHHPAHRLFHRRAQGRRHGAHER